MEIAAPAPASASDHLHFVLFPLMAQGHMVPMVDIGRMLAGHGATVTIITTPLNANRFRQVIDRAIEAKLKIQMLELQLPLAEVGLPEGCESFDTITSADGKVKLFTAMDLLEQQAEDVLRELRPPPACIISDSLFPWTSSLAQRFSIPRLVFHGPGCFWILCMHVVYTTNLLQEAESEWFVLPGLPDRIEVTKPQVSIIPKTATIDEKRFWERVLEGAKAAYGIIVNSFPELEPEYAQELAKAEGKKVWCVGPVSLCNKGKLDIAERGNKAAISEHDCLKWLDERERGSVLYVCLGSLTRHSTDQVIELGLGLESTRRPFIWCVSDKTKELDRWFAEEGFEERVRDRGLIVHGWAPQVLILLHRAIGGFLTHCGWNSTLETICAGVPMVTWPHFGDQFLNEKFIVQILKIGVTIGVKVRVSPYTEHGIGTLVKKDDIKMAVERLMEESKEGEDRRKRVKELGEMAKSTMEEGGSSYLNVLSLIQDIANKSS